MSPLNVCKQKADDKRRNQQTSPRKLKSNKMPRYKHPKNKEEEAELNLKKAVVKAAHYARKNAARNNKRREGSKPCQFLGDLKETHSESTGKAQSSSKSRIMKGLHIAER